MKQDLLRKQQEFFLNDEDLCKLMNDCNSNIDQIEQYSKTAQNMALLVQKISQNQRK